jgi:cytochrome c6
MKSLKLLLLLFLSTLALQASIEEGKDIYLQNCANCHSINMKSGMGKDFNLVSYNRRIEDVVKYIRTPASMFREFGYDSNAMPTLPLSEKEIKDVSEYIDSLQPFKVWMKTEQ